MSKIPVIYWNDGVNQLDPNNLFKNSIYYLIHSLVDKILLYSPNERKYIRPKNQDKIYIANNTIVFDENLYPVNTDKLDLKNKLKVKSKFNILFVGRDRVYKKLDLIIDLVKSIKNKDIGLIIVGPLSDKQKTLQKIGKSDNMKYLGEIYDKTILSEIYSVSDIFCIPGTNGLGLNEAMFWGLPCLTLNVLHSPEIWYLKHGENGFILNSIQELRETIIKLYTDEKLLRKLSSRSREIILSQGHINNMFQGFKEVIESFD
jgi:glycosyltransferase involved in cell wall biosynthesis